MTGLCANKPGFYPRLYGKGFVFGKEHFQAIKALKSDSSTGITRHDKGSGIVLMDKSNYI